jgi:hypothetical protein
VRSSLIYDALLLNNCTVIHQRGSLDLSPSGKVLVVLRRVFRVLQLVRYPLGVVLVYVALIVVDDLSLQDTPKVDHGGASLRKARVPQRHVAVFPSIAEKVVPKSLRHHVVRLKVLRGIIHHGLAVLALVD